MKVTIMHANDLKVQGREILCAAVIYAWWYVIRMYIIVISISFLRGSTVMWIIHLDCQGHGTLQVLSKSANAALYDHKLAETWKLC